MKDDNFEIEELIIPDSQYEYYKEDSVVDDFISELKPLEVANFGLSLDDIKEIAHKYGVDAALEFIEEIKKDVTKENGDDSNFVDDDTGTKEVNKEVIDLSSTSFISPLTGEEVRLDKMKAYDRIGEIYYHTGIVVGVTDKVFVNGYNKGINSFSAFLNSLPLENINDFKVRLGKNWKEKLLQDWSLGWEQQITKTVSKENEKAADRLREDLKNEKIKSSQIEGRVGVLNDALVVEQRKNAELEAKVSNLEVSRDEYLAQLRDAKAALVQQKQEEFVPDFVTPETKAGYDYIVSKEGSAKK